MRTRAAGVPKASPPVPVCIQTVASASHAAPFAPTARPVWSREQLLGMNNAACLGPSSLDLCMTNQELHCNSCTFSLGKEDGRDCMDTITRQPHPSHYKANSFNIRACLINCRSLPKHTDDVWFTLVSYNWDPMFLTETWLKASTNPGIMLAIPECFHIVTVNRDGNKMGGWACGYSA